MCWGGRCLSGSMRMNIDGLVSDDEAVLVRD